MRCLGKAMSFFDAGLMRRLSRQPGRRYLRSREHRCDSKRRMVSLRGIRFTYAEDHTSNWTAARRIRMIACRNREVPSNREVALRGIAAPDGGTAYHRWPYPGC